MLVIIKTLITFTFEEQMNISTHPAYSTWGDNFELWFCSSITGRLPAIHPGKGRSIQKASYQFTITYPRKSGMIFFSSEEEGRQMNGLWIQFKIPTHLCCSNPSHRLLHPRLMQTTCIQRSTCWPSQFSPVHRPASIPNQFISPFLWCPSCHILCRCLGSTQLALRSRNSSNAMPGTEEQMANHKH